MTFIIVLSSPPILWYLLKGSLPRLSNLCGVISVIGIVYIACILISE